MTTTRPSPPNSVMTTIVGRNDGSEAGEDQERRQRENEGRADDDHSDAAGRPAVVEARRAAARR